MALSDHELRALREIERSLLAEDPKFGASVNGVGANGGLGIGVLRSVSIMVLGLVMLVGGVALSQYTLWFIVLAIAGFIVMLAGGIWFVRGSKGGGELFVSAPRGSKNMSQKAKGGIADRMEENFRKRFEG